VTEKCNVIHQSHNDDQFRSEDAKRRGQQGLRNFWLAGDSLFGLSHAGDATHIIQDNEIRRSETKTISVVIPHAGTFEQLRSCLRALSQQSYPRTYIEIIVVENHPKTVAAPALLEFPFITLTREMKPGPAAARNKGAAIAGGEIIAFLDSDCLPAGNWIENGVEVAAEQALQAVVACNVRPWCPGSGARGVQWYESLIYHNQEGFVKSCQACITAGMLVPRNVWVKVGAFDEGFPEAACEDWEWSTRASSLGVPIVYAPRSVVSHPVHGSWRELRNKARRLVRGELLLARKRRRYRLLSVASQFEVYVTRLRAELAMILFKRKMRWSVRLLAATAACAVSLWSVAEARKQITAHGAIWNASKRRGRKSSKNVMSASASKNKPKAGVVDSPRYRP
jgi:GT2 family glycosyltransferase